MVVMSYIISNSFNFGKFKQFKGIEKLKTHFRNSEKIWEASKALKNNKKKPTSFWDLFSNDYFIIMYISFS